MAGLRSPTSRAFTRLALWPRLVIAVTVGFIALYAIFSVLALRGVNESTDRILEERLVMAQMAGRSVDRVVAHGFYELERTTSFAPFDPRTSLRRERHLLAHAYGSAGTFSLGLLLVDERGRVVAARPSRGAEHDSVLSVATNVRAALGARRRTVSVPFLDPNTRRPAVALTVPILNRDGTLRAALTGVLDVSGDDVRRPLEHALELGKTGHAELVDASGTVIASTEGGEALMPGEHLAFFRRKLRDRRAGVETVPVDAGPGLAADRPPERHVMAFARLSAAPWGVALGGLDEETFAPVARLRRDLLLAGALALTLLWALTLFGARLLVRPIRTLTAAAQQMASGNLDRPVRVSEGGEIGALGESLDAMRSQLRESLTKVKRWGATLEAKVQERTAELETRNRQLAAVAAVATAANQPGDLEETLGRCLEAVLDQTGMDAGAVHLDQGLSGPVVRGGPALLSGAGTSVPLRAPDRVLGSLFLARQGDAILGEQDRMTLVAVANEIAVAIQSARLLEELRELEAQREVQRLRAELVSAVSHELRTPLGVIKGYATTLLANDAVDAATRHEFLEAIDEESEKLESMIGDLLDASRLQAGRLTIEPAPLALGELIGRAVAKLRPGLEGAGHALALELPEDDLIVYADPVRTEQVLRNLVDNAVRYSGPAAALGVRVAAENGCATVSVCDSGDGIPEAEQASIFEPFYRGESSRQRGAPGVGLGLAICRGIVESQGGRIWAESAVGTGSTFVFALPLMRDEAPR